MKALTRQADKKVVLDAERKHICVACRESFQYNCRLKYHIRQHHFNRIGLAPYADSQNVNAAWVEKVQNTDTLVQIKKVESNQILIQKIKDDNIEPTNIKREVIDVRKKYPVRSGVEVQCRVCRKSFEKRALSKHFAAQHALRVTKRCEACDTAFKRLFSCASHICPFISIK